MRSRVVVLSLIVVSLPTVLAEGQGSGRTLRVAGCQIGDSILGPARYGDLTKLVKVRYDNTTDTTTLATDALFHPGFRLMASIAYKGAGPTATPAALVVLWVPGDPGRALLHRGADPTVVLDVDDSLPLAVGTARLGHYRGPESMATATVQFQLSAPWSLTLAKAGALRVRVDTFTLDLPVANLQDFNALYRVALCGR